MSETAIRITRTLGVNPQLTENDRYLLMQLTYVPGYTVLLDIFEQACIEQETKLLNADVAAPATVLAEHMLAKAFWQCFVSIQKRIARESAMALEEKPEAEAEPEAGEEIY